MAGRWKRIVGYASVLGLGLILGWLLSMTGHPIARGNGGSVRETSTRIQLSIERLEAEQQELRADLAALRQELAARQQAAAADTDRFQALNQELNRQQLLAGLLPVQGPGVQVTLDDSEVRVPAGANPNDYIIHEYDLRDIVNLLWMAGSEAIAINDERLVGQSSIYCVGSTVMVNNTRLSPPYVIRAIGNPRVQQDYLRNPSYLGSLKEKQQLYDLRFDVRGSPNLALPAYGGSLLVQHARPGE